MFGYTSGSIKKIVFSFPFMKPWTFCISIFILNTFDTFFRIGCTKALNSLFQFAHFTFQRNHIFIQFCIIDIRISPIQISTTVIIYIYGRIYIIPAPVMKGFTDGILKRTDRRITDCHTDRHGIGQFRVQTDIPIKFTITFDALCCPGTIVRPSK